jgi:hypothetical protein
MNNHKSKTTIYFTTATSATDSMLRIFCRIGEFDFSNAKFTNSYAMRGALKELVNVDFPIDGQIHRTNVPQFLNKNIDFDKYKFILNFRDPRDRLCNMFHWALIHPVPGLSKDEVEKTASDLLDQGIDSWVLNKLNKEYYDNFWYLLDRLDEESYEVLSYARLCLEFDSFLEKTASFLNVPLSENIMSDLECERVESLATNDKWIGNVWKGSDTAPGRYKRELKLETILRLNEYYKEVLEKMAHYDPEFSELYL